MTPSLGLCVFVPPGVPFRPTSLQFMAPLFDEALVLKCSESAEEEPRESASKVRLQIEVWQSSYSMARNAALNAMSTDYVFIMEHHERLDSDTVALIRRAIAEDEENSVHCLRVDVETADGQIIDSLLEPRFWRRDDQRQYQGRAFETLRCPDSTQYRHHEDIRLFRASVYGTDEEVLSESQRKFHLLETELVEKPRDRHTRFRVSAALCENGQWDDALTFLEDLIQEDVQDVIALSTSVWLVDCLRALGRPEEAFNQGMSLVKKAPEYGELWYSIGKAALESDQRIKAEAAFKAAHKTHPDHSPELFRDLSIAEYRADLGRAQALASLRDVPATEALLSEVRQRLPTASLHQVDEDFVLIYLQLDQPAKAWDIIEHWLKLEAGWVVHPLRTYLSYVFQMQGADQAYLFFKSALAAYENLLESLPVITVGVELAAQVQDWTSEEDLLRLAVQLGSTQVSHYQRLARLNVEAGDLESAQDMARRARELSQSQ